VRPYLAKTLHEKQLVECLKVYALSSNLSTTKKEIICRLSEDFRFLTDWEIFIKCPVI
jgi:hypothetical protein